MSRKLWLFLGVAVLLAMAACSSSNNTSTSSKVPGTEQAVADAVDVYIYSYPLVTMDMTRRQMASVAMPDAGHAPMGQPLRMRTYPAVD